VTLTPRAAVQPEQPKLDVSTIPVKKGLLDWILFRSEAAVRRRLLGGDGNGKSAIPRHIKEKRLGEAGLQHLSDELEGHLDGWFKAQAKRIAGQLAGDYRRPLLAALLGRLETKRFEAKQEHGAIQAQLDELDQASQTLAEIEVELGEAHRRIAELSERYQGTDPEELVRELTPFRALEPEELTPDAGADRELDPSVARARILELESQAQLPEI
jgi:hypothetical protein